MDNPIIVIDDEDDFLDSLKRGLITAGYKRIVIQNNPLEAAALFRKGEIFDAALIDITMPRMGGIELLQTIKASSPETECIMVTALNEAQLAVECLKNGAYDYLVKPISREDLLLKLNRALERKRLFNLLEINQSSKPLLENSDVFSSIITRSSGMQRLLKEAELHAASDVPILITGESGTGKELMAQAIHDASPRASFPYSVVNMASMSSGLFDAEFFGHTKGAYTGAQHERKGFLKSADKGTLFLDEIGHLPEELQGKLLRVLQEGEYHKLGTDALQTVNARFIAATNINLEQAMEKGRFRKDLFYRLRGAWLHLPPLRERKEDIPVLFNHFLDQSATRRGRDVPDPDVLAILACHDFPGNIRELASIVQYAKNLSQGGTIKPVHLPEYLRHIPVKKSTDPCRDFEPKPLSDIEKNHILKTYAHTGQNKSKTARILKIGLNTLRRKLAAYGKD